MIILVRTPSTHLSVVRTWREVWTHGDEARNNKQKQQQEEVQVVGCTFNSIDSDK
jgi:hypothetical protein